MSDPIAETERMLREHEERVDRARRIRAELAQDTFEASSADRMVTATVDANGRLVGVDFQQAALNRGDGTRLRTAVLDAVGAAQTAAATAQVAAIREALGVTVEQTDAGTFDAHAAVEAAARRRRDTP